MSKPRQIEVGSLVIPTRKGISAIKMAFPNAPVSETYQLRVAAVVNRNVYKRKCYMVQDAPMAEPVAVWGTQIRLTSSKHKADPRWS